MSKNKSNQRASRQKYSPQFKDQALARAEKNGASQVAKELGINDV